MEFMNQTSNFCITNITKNFEFIGCGCLEDAGDLFELLRYL